MMIPGMLYTIRPNRRKDRRLTVKKWSWEGVAHTVLASCAGDIDELPVPVLPE
jgi:hypothetical protein